jgi:hypothetical protein
MIAYYGSSPLQDLQSVYQKNKHHCQSMLVSSGIAHIAKHFVFHADYDDAFGPMLFHLANRTDYNGFVQRCAKDDHEFARQHRVEYTTRPSCCSRSSTTPAPFGDQGLSDKGRGSQPRGRAFQQGPSIAAGATRAQSPGPNESPLQTATILPPQSSSLLSHARKMAAIAPHLLQQHQRSSPRGHSMFPDPLRDTNSPYKHFDIKPNAAMEKSADHICSQLDEQPAVTPGIMNTAVLESIAGLEAILRDRKLGDPQELRNAVASVSSQ